MAEFCHFPIKTQLLKEKEDLLSLMLDHLFSDAGLDVVRKVLKL